MVNTQCLTKCLRRAEGNDSLIFSTGLVVFLSTVRHWNILYFFWLFGGELIKVSIACLPISKGFDQLREQVHLLNTLIARRRYLQ